MTNTALGIKGNKPTKINKLEKGGIKKYEQGALETEQSLMP